MSLLFNIVLVFWMSSFKPTFSLSSFTFIKRPCSSSSLSEEGWCHLHIWGYWCFYRQSWFQLVLHPTQHFLWCTLSSVQFSRSVVSDSLRPHESQHAKPPCPSPTPRVHSDFTSIKSVMPSSHLILCCPLLLLPPIPPSIRVFSSKSTLRIYSYHSPTVL